MLNKHITTNPYTVPCNVHPKCIKSSERWDHLCGTTFEAYDGKKKRTKAEQERADEAKRQMVATMVIDDR